MPSSTRRFANGITSPNEEQRGPGGRAEVPLALEGRSGQQAALTSVSPWEGLLLLQEKTASKTRTRKKGKGVVQAGARSR